MFTACCARSSAQSHLLSRSMRPSFRSAEAAAKEAAEAAAKEAAEAAAKEATPLPPARSGRQRAPTAAAVAAAAAKKPATSAAVAGTK